MRCYGNLSLTVTSPVQSFAEPLTLAEVKKFLNLPERSPADEEEDAELEGMIAGVRAVAEYYQNRDLVEKQYDLTLDYFPWEIELRTPLVSVELIQYTDSENAEHTVDPANYLVDTARGIVLPAYGKSWPSFTARPSSAVLVRFSSGMSLTDLFWKDSGRFVRIGMLNLISDWYNGRLPYETNTGGPIGEYPLRLTNLLSMGAVPRAR